jgi:hypothetical protein
VIFDADQEEEQEAPRGRGRPPGAENGSRTGEASASQAPIVNWLPKHDMVVALHVGMQSTAEIAQLVGYTSTRINQILNDPTGKAKIREAQESLRERLSAQIEDGLVAICVKALQNVRETIELEGLAYGSDFKKHQDRLSVEVLKGRGFLDKERPTRDAPAIDPILVKRLADAMEKSNQAADFLQKEREDREIVVEDAEIIEKSGDFSLVKT